MSAPRHKYVAVKPIPARDTRRIGPRRWAYHQPVRPYRSSLVVLRRLVFFLLVLLVVLLIGSLTLKVWVDGQTDNLIFSNADTRKIPHNHAALVFGAGLNRAGGPSAMLYDRVATASKLYSESKVDKLLMSGDNGAVNYNEVEVMRKTAVDLGVADEDIVLDYAGFSTWDTCYRAREVFNIETATLVTQRFHLPRAVYTCRELGINPVGVAADTQSYPTLNNEVRELPALTWTFWSLLVNRQPHFLGPKVDIDQKQER